MQPYDQMPGLEKMCLIFLYDPNDFFVWLWAWKQTIIFKKRHMLYVVMFGYGRRPSHCNAHI